MITTDLSELTPDDAPRLTPKMTRILILIAKAGEDLLVGRPDPATARMELADLIADWHHLIDP